MLVSQFSLRAWILAARPKTLIASLTPVIMGLVLVYSTGSVDWPLAVLTLVSACTLQIGTNYVNDLYDFLKGADRSDRLGPTRAVQAGLVTPSQMRIGIGVVFLICMASGAIMVRTSGPLLLWLGVIGIGMGILYTAGPRPLAYNGWSDLMVLLFFGVLAVAGTVYVQTNQIDVQALIAGIGPGLISTGILVVNNLRDIEQDTRAGRRNLIIRFGRRFGRLEYTLCLLGAAVVPFVLFGLFDPPTTTLLPAASFLLALPVIRTVWTQEGPVLNKVLAQTSAILLVYCILFSLGWIWG